MFQINPLTIFTILFLFPAFSLCMLLLLVTNKRKGIIKISYIIAGALLIGPLITFNNFNHLSLKDLVFSRNVSLALGVLLLIQYTILHIVIHGVAWIFERKRQIITKRGLITYFLLIFLYILIATFSISPFTFFFHLLPKK